MTSGSLGLPHAATDSATAAALPVRPAPAQRPVPRLTVVVPTYRRHLLLLRCLRALVAQRFDSDDFEILVVDDAGCTETHLAVSAIAHAQGAQHTVRYIRPRRGHGPAVARNCGWAGARGEIVAFTDDDTVPHPDWLAHGARAMAGGAIAAAGRVDVPAPVDEATGRPRRPTDHELMTMGLGRAEFVTANAFVRRSALMAVGGFDERFERAWREDSDLHFKLMALGGEVVRCDDAVVVHPVRPERWGVSLRQQKNVFYDALLFKKHPALYRERCLASPPWHYYGVVGLSLGALALWALGIGGSAIVSAAIAAGLVLRFAWRRLRHTAKTPEHIVEMIATSAAIPFLSVWWRLRGALRFGVLYL